MNKNAIKKYSIWAREKLISQIIDMAYLYGIEKDKEPKKVKVVGDAYFLDDKLISKEVKFQRDKLIERINTIGFCQTIEEVAYTWFNRFIAIRYMEVNGYLPGGILVFQSIDESKKPAILRNPLKLYFLDEEDKKKVSALMLESKDEELLKYLLISLCNELNKFLPFLFENKNHYTELLFPDGLLNDDSVIMRLIKDIDSEDFKNVEILGWMYQYYISNKKDEVFAKLKNSNSKIKKEEIPAVTQLFTPDWIVKYMVENSLGRLWIEGHEDFELKSKWNYYIDDAEQDEAINKELENLRKESKKIRPEQLTILDPACGSGHILVYAFDVLYDIYKRSGYDEREIPIKIIENNLYGLDIDERAAQLAAFAVIMKAREKESKFFKLLENKNININILSIEESNSLLEYQGLLIDFCKDEKDAEEQIKILLETFYDAKNYGSLIKVENIDFNFWDDLINKWDELINNFNQKGRIEDSNKIEKISEMLFKLIKQAKIMSQKYYVLCTNPPYMGSRGMNEKLANFLKRNYPDTKQDLFAAFMELDNQFLIENGFLAMITQHSWMFLSNFEKLRINILSTRMIYNMLHLGPRAFEEIGGEVVQSTAFVIRKHILDFKGTYIRLVDFENAELKEKKALEAIKNSNIEYKYSIFSKSFGKIPGIPFAYWISEKIRDIFEKAIPLSKIAEPRQGLATADNNRFLRLWFEVNYKKIGLGFSSREKAKQSKLKWFPINKGGEYRKWYGNNEYVVNWQNDGEEIKKFEAAFIRNQLYYFNEGLTWSRISSSNFAVRYFSNGFIFSDAGSSLFIEKDKLLYILSFLSTKIAYHFLMILNPTLTFQVGDISKLPVKLIENKSINILSQQNIEISKTDWDSFETSWDFKKHPLLIHKNGAKTVEEAFKNWEMFTNEQFIKLKQNEEELNRIFIRIYGLQDELNPEVKDEDVTIRRADLKRDIKSFISYAVGCMMGRYSLDEDGLVYAGGEFDIRRYKTFKPVEDGIIPITDNQYLNFDIVAKFKEFLKISFGEEYFNENIEFIASVLEKKEGETADDTIRRYFLKDFYKDHVKVYKQRPIYWLFTSGKERGFNALVYIHRYDKNTIAKLRTEYMHELENILENTKKMLEDTLAYGNLIAKEKKYIQKRIDTIKKQLSEIRGYDELLKDYAEQYVELDLDDGVKANYTKLIELLEKIKL